jgi:hypothetical protein
MVKKIVLLIAVLVVSVGFLSGCTSTTNDGDNNEDESTKTEPTVTYSYSLINGSEYEDIRAIITITNEDYEKGVSSAGYYWDLEVDSIRYDGYTTYSTAVDIMPNGTQTITIGYNLDIQFVYLQEYQSAVNHARTTGRIIYTGDCPYMKLVE